MKTEKKNPFKSSFKLSTFLTSRYSIFGRYSLGFLTKPPISNFFNADYAIFTVGQGGCGITLIELESPSDKLFTKKTNASGKASDCTGQIDDWNQWLVENKNSFITTCLGLLKKCKKLPDISENLSFKTITNTKMNDIWNAFGGAEECFITNLVIIGRGSQLNEKERKRLIFHNS